MIRYSLALGFASRSRDAEPVVLYAGKSFEEARKAMANPPAGIAYAVAIKNPLPTKKWNAPAAAPAPITVDEPPVEVPGVTVEEPATETPAEDPELLPDAKPRRKA
jgi:hypothetical protein